MATVTFEPTLSGSALRAPFATAFVPSMADTLPDIDFNFDDLRDRMAKFTVRFDEFIERGRKRVLEERNQFRVNLAELKEDHRQTARAIEITSLKTQTHSQTLKREEQETSEMQSAIDSLEAQREVATKKGDELHSQISVVKAQIAQRRDALAKRRAALDAQARHNAPELEFWESYLGLRIEGGGGDDRLRFVFSGVDERDWERQCWFELDMRSREYKILDMGGLPNGRKTEEEQVDRVLDQLNESRELGPFLKGMRTALADACR